MLLQAYRMGSWLTLFLVLADLECASSFHLMLRPIATPAKNMRLSSGRDEEVSRLEEQIRRLREEEEQIDDEIEEMEQEEAAATRSINLQKVSGKDMLLTEGALIDQKIIENEPVSSASVLSTAVGLVLGIAFLIVFSQFPLGQDELSRYSATGSSIIKTIDLGDLNPDRKSI